MARMKTAGRRLFITQGMPEEEPSWQGGLPTGAPDLQRIEHSLPDRSVRRRVALGRDEDDEKEMLAGKGVGNDSDPLGHAGPRVVAAKDALEGVSGRQMRRLIALGGREVRAAAADLRDEIVGG